MLTKKLRKVKNGLRQRKESWVVNKPIMVNKGLWYTFTTNQTKLDDNSKTKKGRTVNRKQ
ncbi:hypothetical protein MJO29_016097 [Puccinia striiformis f. sp. tritici]|nr:hypothetical protein MJO29_016097 [Puccinia striiformis f. sp. tritici]